MGASDADAITGSVTPLQRVVVSEKTQQESVAFGELAEQYEQRPARFVVKPQSSGWFATASMQLPVMELAGRAQFVKSARICVSAFAPALPQMSLAAIFCSL